MNTTLGLVAAEPSTGDWLELARTLGRRFGARAADVDRDDRFVADNYADLEAYGFFAAGVPVELGGGGLAHADLGDLLRELARHCGSTALAFAMHTHQVAAAAWRWRHQKAPVDGLLRRVATEQIVLLSSGGSDWLARQRHGDARRRRLSHRRAQDLRERGAGGRSVHHDGGLRRSRGRPDSPPSGRADELRPACACSRRGARSACAERARTTSCSRTSSCRTRRCRCGARAAAGTRRSTSPR